jgi:hypothetical protein
VLLRLKKGDAWWSRADASCVERKFMNLEIGVFAIAAGLVGAVLFSQSQRPAAMPYRLWADR